jgi:hypothetical protein
MVFRPYKFNLEALLMLENIACTEVMQSGNTF